MSTEVGGDGWRQIESEMQATSSKVYSGLVDRREARRIERLAEGLSQNAPPWASQYLLKAAPAAGAVGSVVQKVGPGIFEFYTGLYKLFKRLPQNAVSMLWGLSLCFYGGRFPLALSALECFKLTGGSELAMHLTTIKETIETVQEASAADDEEDTDGNGQKDVEELEPKALAQRKLGLALRIIDPGELSEALRGIWAGFVGVIAALQTEYARTTALAHSIGDHCRPIVAKLMAPSCLSVTPPEYHKWVNPGINYFCKFMAVALAWKLQKILSTFQSGVAGGLLAARSSLALMQHYGILKEGELGDGMTEDIVGWGLAASGIYYQLIQGGAAPLFFVPVLWPLGFVERWLQLCVATVRP
mmetsp:Transcript_54770/g.116955  ORF Transcript_54770/g.116955 Transcript_54770/m.116955 type:complete len:359 (-) Transcript_54770:79-1155(-)|eukprot:CAMPEP_0206546950 /NCGR_PEP_ID=MMETSP0325_2-20121206/13021_1 /ASSEMBLY_ACC=CAM_ASM_000347 /TAXON_ID=2866 /ORGANISM="Crypthecodinium cohnii, Strain Seligo" /LENGTH=358 /DNA_ID=CAMNT_0054046193 /DNA_START=275 /DNA_END=1347 /DNA_ORIENTATION=-